MRARGGKCRSRERGQAVRCRSGSGESRIEASQSELASKCGISPNIRAKEFAVAKIFDLHSFRNRKNGQSPSRNDSDAGRMGGSDAQPINGERGVSGRLWPVSISRISLNAGAGLLVAIGVFC